MFCKQIQMQSQNTILKQCNTKQGMKWKCYLKTVTLDRQQFPECSVFDITVNLHFTLVRKTEVEWGFHKKVVYRSSLHAAFKPYWVGPQCRYPVLQYMASGGKIFCFLCRLGSQGSNKSFLNFAEVFCFFIFPLAKQIPKLEFLYIMRPK